MRKHAPFSGYILFIIQIYCLSLIVNKVHIHNYICCRLNWIKMARRLPVSTACELNVYVVFYRCIIGEMMCNAMELSKVIFFCIII
ncbi:hypothetical protein GDO81_013093 [Engystomops pustulosus]|uniref:Secreted protein n=1 Tax=Engystomops pustulosus TaxID=76066 RepID=A0AAV7B163_ENGPU|nr:hypothetical protein GDO81_013093 [Engystomops pustulosus]